MPFAHVPSETHTIVVIDQVGELTYSFGNLTIRVHTDGQFRVFLGKNESKVLFTSKPDFKEGDFSANSTNTLSMKKAVDIADQIREWVKLYSDEALEDFNNTRVRFIKALRVFVVNANTNVEKSFAYDREYIASFIGDSDSDPTTNDYFFTGGF